MADNDAAKNKNEKDPQDSSQNHRTNVRRRLDFAADNQVSQDSFVNNGNASNGCRRLDFQTEHPNDCENMNPLEPSRDLLQSERQRGIKKWNFDFENEIPLEGDWEWEKVSVEPTEKEIVSTMEKKHLDNRTV